jgi:hypothetical protein
LLFSTPFLLLFFSIIPLPPLAFVCVHFFAIPFPLLFSIVFQWRSLHSCCCELHSLKNAHNFQQQTQTTFDNYLVFFVLEHPTRCIHFLHVCCLLINVGFLKLIQPIITSLCVFYTTTWKHFLSSLWTNAADFIFWLLPIANLPLLTISIPPRSPYIHANYAQSSNDCHHKFVDYTNFFADYANKYDDYANTPDDWMNIVVDSPNTPNKSSLDICVPNPSLL